MLRLIVVYFALSPSLLFSLVYQFFFFLRFLRLQFVEQLSFVNCKEWPVKSSSASSSLFKLAYILAFSMRSGATDCRDAQMKVMRYALMDHSSYMANS